MSIKLKVTEQDKKVMSNCNIEVRVLDKLVAERKFIMEKKVKEVMEYNQLNSKLYMLKFNVAQDTWEAELLPGALTLPVPGSDPIQVKKN